MNELGVGVVVLWYHLGLKNDLDEAAWEVLEKDELLEC